MDAVLWPVRLLVLVILHVVYASARLFHVLAGLSLRPASSTPPTIEHDMARKRWKKTPNHIAVVFVPSKKLPRFSWRTIVSKSSAAHDRETEDLQKLIVDLRRLLSWCETLRLSSLSVYDEHGILDRNAEVVKSELLGHGVLMLDVKDGSSRTDGFASFHVATPRRSRYPPSRAEDWTLRDMDSPNSSSDSCSESPAATATPSSSLPSSSPSSVIHPLSSDSSHANSFRVNLLSRLAGRPQLAKVAQQLCLRGAEGVKLAHGAVEELMELSPIAEPDLLLVLGGPYLRLRGFPPWQLRLTEMYHYSSPTWLPAPPLIYPMLRNALDVYGGAEMRLGR